jgi:hypothetical protein
MVFRQRAEAQLAAAYQAAVWRALGHCRLKCLCCRCSLCWNGRLQESCSYGPQNRETIPVLGWGWILCCSVHMWYITAYSNSSFPSISFSPYLQSVTHMISFLWSHSSSPETLEPKLLPTLFPGWSGRARLWLNLFGVCWKWACVVT